MVFFYQMVQVIQHKLALPKDLDFTLLVLLETLSCRMQLRFGDGNTRRLHFLYGTVNQLDTLIVRVSLDRQRGKQVHVLFLLGENGSFELRFLSGVFDQKVLSEPNGGWNLQLL